MSGKFYSVVANRRQPNLYVIGGGVNVRGTSPFNHGMVESSTVLFNVEKQQLDHVLVAVVKYKQTSSMIGVLKAVRFVEIRKRSGQVYNTPEKQS